MFGAFFIATDPVTASITPKGKWIFGGLIGLLVCLIRANGNYPDGVAFAVLLANICVPLIDHYTRPVVSGHKNEVNMQTAKMSGRYGLLLGSVALICTALSAGVYF